MSIPAHIQAAIDRKPVYAPTDDHPKRASAKSKRAICNDSLAATPIQKESPQSRAPIHIVITSFRRRLLDDDNLCGKFFVDGLRYAKVIRDDTPGLVSIETRQSKVAKQADERTEIIVESIP